MSRSPQSSEPDGPKDDPIVVDPPGAPATDYVDGVPTFDFVRDRIEGRYATAVGATELADESEAGRTVAQQQEDRDAAARERLEQIRRSLRGV
jgi:phage shock protein A